MNNIQELIERLDAIKALVPEIGMANCEAPIDDAITALERLWRENAALMDENVWLQKAQARIERHKCTEWIKGRCTECDEHYTDYVEKLHAALESMQAPPPKDVEKIAENLHRIARKAVHGYSNDTFGVPLPERVETKAAEMLERLARENENAKNYMVNLSKTVTEQAQRIEELENWYNTPGLETTRTNIKLLKRIEELEDIIKRLDAALAEIIEHYKSAQAGDCEMNLCAEIMCAMAIKARAGE